MNSERPSEAPEEPLQRSEPAVLSPVSPKPVQFPQPTNIPVLDMQMDVAFNQTEKHMADPAMHNTEVRPDFWRDPNEQQQQQQQQQNETNDHASPFSTGAGESAEAAKEVAGAGDTSEQVEPGQITEDSADTTANGATQSQPSPTLNDVSSQAGGQSIQAAHHGDAAQTSASDPSTLNPLAAPQSGDAPAQSYDAAPEHAQSAAPSYSGNVDVQALLDTLAAPPAPSNANASSADLSQSHQAPPGVESAPMPISALGGTQANGLPARPPPQEQPLINPNYAHSQHIRDYHPHAAHSAFQPQHGRSNSNGNVADPNRGSFVPPVPSPGQQTSDSHATAAGAAASFYNGQRMSSSNPPLPVPLPASRPLSAIATPIESKRESKLAVGQIPSPEDRPWNADVQAKYDRFLELERGYVSEGKWEQFPAGSRLFVGMRNADGRKAKPGEVMLTDDIGNLSSEKVTKRDIYHIFHWYGELAQISIKQAYGFVQFLHTEDCVKALHAEQGTWIRDKRIHLEVSKPQKNSRNQGQQQQQQQARRSRSPEYGRGGRAPPGTDRYTSSRNGGRGYRQGGTRSPSPARGYRGGYDRYRERSPSYDRRPNYGRSPPPRRNSDDDLPMPRRQPHEVPDVQIVVPDTLNRDFIGWVQGQFRDSGIRTEVLYLSPRMDERAVVRRQIVEGVLAVVRLTRANQDTGKIGLQLFDRSRGSNNVQFNEYQDLDPSICAALVQREKGMAGRSGGQAPPTPNYGGYGGQYQQPPPPPQQYGGPPSSAYQQGYGGAYPPTPAQPPCYNQPPMPAQYGQPAPPQQPQPGAGPPNLQNIINNLNPNGYQNAMPAYGGTPNTATPQSAYPPSAYPQSAYPAQPPQQQSGGGQVNMQDILARLGNYDRR
ncbi:putative RNA-binding protein [Teratosphaeria destructans]|uniref:RNA-binding protein n=1 Tax=Teratosphaeria destructans TaxID=418781 RepID=A0A9W7SLR6_9PEZI|nr:putative RNA-binding protein [Teratosphaeria destructans]